MQDFSGQNLRGRNFKGQDLTGANFAGADIRGANFSQAILRNADFSGVTAGLATSWRIPAMLWGLGLCGLGLGLTYGAAYIGGFLLSFDIPFFGWLMLADLVIHPLLNQLILVIGFSLLTIGGWHNTAILTCQFLFLLPLSLIVAFFSAVRGVMDGSAAYLAAGHVESDNVGVFAVIFFAWIGIPMIAMINMIWSSIMAWEYVKKSRQRQSNHQSQPTDPKNSLLQATTIALLGNGLTRFRGADLTGTNFTDANLQDAEF
jgi:Pentapeptide repeats (8 copies)